MVRVWGQVTTDGADEVKHNVNNTASVLLSTNADDDRVEVVHDAIVAKRDHGAGRTGEEQGPGRSEHSGVADSAATTVWVPQVSRGRDHLRVP